MENLVCYKQLPIWTLATIPQGFKNQHNTKAGTWAKLEVLQGQLSFAFLTDTGQIVSEHVFSPEQPAPFVEPQAWHKIISASDEVKCQLSFYCHPDNYFAKKYQLSNTHSEMIAALPYLQGGRALDVGCGSGRNSLYLSQHGFDVDAWDVNPNSIAKLNQVIEAEQIEKISTQLRDLNLDPTIDQHYDFICCTVVMMFLQASTTPALIRQMQQATLANGFNLIVCAMDSEDYPVQQDFPFAFRTQQLQDYYASWKIIKYNEDVGQLHRLDQNGERIKQRFATLLAQKPAA